MGKATADWNERNQETAKAWGRQALILKWLHYQASMFYQKLDRWLGIPAFFYQVLWVRLSLVLP